MQIPDSRLRGSRSAVALKRGLEFGQIGLVAGIALMCLVISLKTPYFFLSSNFANLGIAISYTGIIAAGFTLVLIGGGIDLSVGSVAAVGGQTYAFALGHGLPFWAAVAAALLVGAACGGVNALLIVGVGINPIVTTIATQFIFRGVAFAYGGGLSGGGVTIENHTASNLANSKWLGVPVPTYLMLTVFLIVGFLYRYTRFGSNITAAGGSRVAARRAGIAVGLTSSLTYILCALLAAFSGVLLDGLDGFSDPTVASGIELTVLAALVIGGTSLAGGVGTVLGTLLGVFALGILQNGLNLLGVSAFWKQTSIGVALLLAIAIDSVRRQFRVARA